MPNARIQATSLTGGSATPGLETISGGYRWRGNPDWEPGHPDFRENTSERLLAGAAAHIARRRGREDRFAAILKEHGVTDLWDVPPAAVIKAGVGVGVGEKTAKSYLAALKRRQESAL